MRVPALRFPAQELVSFIQGLTSAKSVWCVYVGRVLNVYVNMTFLGYIRSWLMHEVWQGHIDKWTGPGTNVRMVYKWRNRRHS